MNRIGGRAFPYPVARAWRWQVAACQRAARRGAGALGEQAALGECGREARGGPEAGGWGWGWGWGWVAAAGSAGGSRGRRRRGGAVGRGAGGGERPGGPGLHPANHSPTHSPLLSIRSSPRLRVSPSFPGLTRPVCVRADQPPPPPGPADPPTPNPRRHAPRAGPAIDPVAGPVKSGDAKARGWGDIGGGGRREKGR